MMRIIAWIILKVGGWKLEGQRPPMKRYVMIAAPHTSNWDMVLMLSCSYSFRLPLRYMAKQVIFWGPFGVFFRWMGGIAIDRSKANNLIQQMKEEFPKQDEMALIVPPEGTRGKTEYWKSGFYYIAKEAGVPIVLTYLDYSRKIGGIGPAIMPTDDIVADMDKIRDFYKGMKGRFPEMSGPIRLRDEENHGAKTGTG